METNVRKRKHKKYIYPKTWKITALKQTQHEKQLLAPLVLKYMHCIQKKQQIWNKIVHKGKYLP